VSKKKPKKRRRARGGGSIYKIGKKGRLWWIAYSGPDGKRVAESTGSARKGDATTLLQRRIGAREHGLPVIPRVEKTTFEDAVKAMREDFANSGKKSGDDVERRIRLHLRPVFGGRRLVSITATDVRSYTTKRLADTIVVRKAQLNDNGEIIEPEQRKPVSPAQVNRELQTLKRLLSMAVEDGKLAARPHIAMLRENNVRTGFFEVAQYRAVLKQLPAEIRPVIEFAYITGWRIASEVVKLEWRNLDLNAGEVRLDAGSTKNDAGRVFPMTTALHAMLKTQHVRHLALKKAGQFEPWVFWRMVAKKRGGPKRPLPILSFSKAWHAACVAAGCPGKIPHDFRRTAVRNLVRAGVSETVAMRLTGHKTRSVFDRYDIVSGGDLRDAARKLDEHSATSSRTRTASR
jgi:integrase